MERHRCVMDSLWSRDSEADPHGSVIILEYSDGFGNNVRGFGAAVALAMWSGRPLQMSYPLVERNFDPPSPGRAWFTSGDDRRQSDGTRGIPELAVDATKAAAVWQVAKLDKDMLNVMPRYTYVMSEPGATWPWFKTPFLRDCVERVYGEPTDFVGRRGRNYLAASALSYALFLAEIFKRPGLAMREQLAELRERNGLAPAAAEAGLRAERTTVVAMHLRAKPADIEHIQSEANGIEKQEAIAASLWNCARQAMAGQTGKKLAYFATDAPVFRESAKGNLTDHMAVTWQAGATMSHTIRKSSRKTSSQETDPAGADRAMFDYFMLAAADIVVLQTSSFSCTAALAGIARGTVREVWNYNAFAGSQSCTQIYDAGSNDESLSSKRIDLRHCSA
jgi:hypothetical protein